jgi:hypothetical protein
MLCATLAHSTHTAVFMLMTYLLYIIQGHGEVRLRRCKSIVIILFMGQLSLAVELFLLEHFFHG